MTALATYRIVDAKHYDGRLVVPRGKGSIGRRTIYVITINGRDETWTSFRDLAVRWCRA